MNKIKRIFEEIAPHYDMMNNVLSFGLHRRWRRFAMQQMRVMPGDSALDICCGTCDWTLSLAESAGADQVIGLDFSDNMLQIGESKLKKRGQSQVQLITADAMKLPFADDTFDHVTVGFALRNVPDPIHVLREMARVTKPGGQVVSLELSHPVQPMLRPFYRLYKGIIPQLGRLLANKYDHYQWLPASLPNVPDRFSLARLLRTDVGLVQIKVFPLTGGVAALHMGRKVVARDRC